MKHSRDLHKVCPTGLTRIKSDSLPTAPLDHDQQRLHGSTQNWRNQSDLRQAVACRADEARRTPLKISGGLKDVEFTFFEVVDNPAEDRRCTVLRAGKARLTGFGTQSTTALLHDLPAIVNGREHRVASGAVRYNGWVNPGTRRQRQVQFAELSPVNGAEKDIKIVLLAGDLRPGEEVSDVEVLAGEEDLSHEAMPCFTEGARILTAFGDVPVEDLRTGDLIHTIDNGLQPIKWIGKRELGGARLHVEPQLLPVRICANAFGTGQPYTDILLSPGHRILLEDALLKEGYSPEGLLAPIEALINGKTVRTEEEIRSVTYYHLLFEEHQIVYVEGFQAETFFPTPAAIANITGESREALYQAVPRLRENPLGFGQTARRVISREEARSLAA